MATKKEPENESANEAAAVAPFVPKYTDDELLSIQSFEDAYRLAAQYYGEENLVRADETIGNGFRLLADKDTLIDTPMILLGWRFNPGDFGTFVSVVLVTQDGRKFVVNDGSSGICEQLNLYTSTTGNHGGMLVPKGFTRSDYTYEDENGEERPAKTYYLNTSA